MRTTRMVGLGLFVLGLTAGPARADGFFTPHVGVNFGGDSSHCASLTTCEEKRVNVGFSFGTMGSVFGVEVDVGYAKDFFGRAPGADSSVFSWMNSVLLGIGAGPVQPYLLAGFGLIRPHTSLNLNELTDFKKNAFGYDLGGGVHLYFSRHVGVRADIRHLHTVQDVPILKAHTVSNEKLDFWRASIGITLR